MAAPLPDPDVAARLLRSRLVDGPLEIPVSGVSMRGVIESGSTVEVHAAEGPRVGEIWAFTEDGGTVVVHRVRHIHPEGVVGRGSGNPTDDELVGHQRLIGRVVSAAGPAGVRRFGRFDRVRAAAEFAIRATARRVLRTLSRG